MIVDRTDVDHLLGLVQHARTHVDRANLGAVAEALDDAERRLRIILKREGEDDDGGDE